VSDTRYLEKASRCPLSKDYSDRQFFFAVSVSSAKAALHKRHFLTMAGPLATLTSSSMTSMISMSIASIANR
jgi:hypothetical protein